MSKFLDTVTQAARYNKTIFIALSALFLISAPAKAQLIPDNTLGGESSVVVPDTNIQNRDNIEGGARRGTNLFHSFREFNVNQGREVYFNNPSGVRNIINRVTGSNISNIFGTLGVSGNANLYLINPNGIVFGDGAFLDINGTFIGTTADGVRLGANDVYSASDPASSSLLTIQPEALFVNRKNAQIRAIRNQGNLEVNTGASLTLSADEINNSGSINVPGGNVLIEAVNGDINTANINVSSTTANGGNIDLKASGNINVFDGADIFADGILGGSINITSKGDLTANNASITSTSTGNVIGKGRDINVNTRSIEFNNSILVNRTGGSANAGHVTIETDSLLVRDGAVISARTRGRGNSGNLTVSANKIELIGSDVVDGSPSGLFAASVGEGNAGHVTIETDSLLVRDGAVISARTRGRGNSGNLTVSANKIELIGLDVVDGSSSGLLTETLGEGNAGHVTIETDSLLVQDGAVISASTFSRGNSGNLTVTANKIELIGVNPLARIPSGLFAASVGEGNAGNLSIETDSLRILDGAQISASTFSRGNGGNLTVTANKIELIGVNPVNASFPSGLFAQSNSGASGNAGELTVTTKNLLISDRATISAASRETGSSGNINLFADSIRIENNGRVEVLSEGTGISGDIIISGNSIKLDRGILNAESNSAAGGNINITLTESLTLTNSSRITTEAGVDRLGTGDGGNIEIDSRLIIASPEDNIITADAFGGTGGNINITTNAILGYPQFLTITASSELGIDGTIKITGIVDLNSDILPAEPVVITTTPPQLARCPIQGQPTELNSAIGDGTGEKIKLELFRRKNSNPEASEANKESAPKKLQPAVGWYRKPDGTVVLTSDPAKVRPLNQPVDYSSGCRK